jgi:hypothetical protein
MRNRAGRTLGVVGALAAVFVLAFSASPAAAVDIIEAQSETADAGWQAGTCQLDPLNECSPARPDLFFTQAAGHPPTGFTQIIVKHGPPGETPVGDLKTVRVDLPVGLSVNPQATPWCKLEPGQSPSTCPPTSQVGTSAISASAVSVVGLPLGTRFDLPPVPVYNIEPLNGEPARFGFEVAGTQVFLEAGVAWQSDYHEFFTIKVAKIELPIGPLGALAAVKLLENRLVFFGTTGQPLSGAFLTTPSTCFDPTAALFTHTYSTFLRADSYQEEAPQFPVGGQELEAPLPKVVKPTGCDKVPFNPSVGTSGGTAKTDSPDAPTIEVGVPYEPAAEIANSNVRTARVTTPRGLGLNPSSAPGLKACTDKQFGKGTTAPVACPAGSVIGTVSIQTPVLPPDSLSGNVYLGEQLSRNPTSGKEYRVFINAEAPRFGQSVRLVGEVSADPATGQLTTKVEEAPQLPFTSVKVKFDGAKGVLTSPPTCGPNQTTGQMTPWSGTADAKPADQGFTLTAAPAGGPCAKTMAQRPFSPGFEAKPAGTKAAKYTDFEVQITRPDGQQELKGADITLPPGATAKLKGVPYCTPADLKDAAGSSAAAEAKKSSCPEKSLIGTASVRAGSGPSPLQIGGKVFLSGPYKGAPLSLAVITPAAAGPFDLGTVVVRVALFIEPESARVHPVSDPIPDVFGGAKLSIRSVRVDINRKTFARNGTNCRASATAGVLRGGGADPTKPALFSSFPVSTPFKATKCKPLKFRPKLKLRLFGQTERAQHPKLRAVLRARGKDANIRRASVALPHALFLDQASLATICTRVQFAANQCPKRSVYGYAKATSPLLGKPLKGPVYLRSSNNPLPDLVAHLKGQVTIDLVGKIDSFQGGIRTTFNRSPDVPVSKFTMVLPGGKGGLLVASRDLCQAPVRGIVKLKAHNGRKRNSRPILRTPCSQKPSAAPKRSRQK